MEESDEQKQKEVSASSNSTETSTLTTAFLSLNSPRSSNRTSSIQQISQTSENVDRSPINTKKSPLSSSYSTTTTTTTPSSSKNTSTTTAPESNSNSNLKRGLNLNKLSVSQTYKDTNILESRDTEPLRNSYASTNNKVRRESKHVKNPSVNGRSSKDPSSGDSVCNCTNSEEIYELRKRIEKLQKEKEKAPKVDYENLELQVNGKTTSINVYQLYRSHQSLKEDFDIVLAKYDNLKCQIDDMLWLDLPKLSDDFDHLNRQIYRPSIYKPPDSNNGGKISLVNDSNIKNDTGTCVNNFLLGDKLGEGKFAQVRKCKYLNVQFSNNDNNNDNDNNIDNSKDNNSKLSKEKYLKSNSSKYENDKNMNLSIKIMDKSFLRDARRAKRVQTEISVLTALSSIPKSLIKRNFGIDSNNWDEEDEFDNGKNEGIMIQNTKRNGDGTLDDRIKINKVPRKDYEQEKGKDSKKNKGIEHNIQMIDHFQTSSHIYIVMERLEVDLYDYMYRKKEALFFIINTLHKRYMEKLYQYEDSLMAYEKDSSEKNEQDTVLTTNTKLIPPRIPEDKLKDSIRALVTGGNNGVASIQLPELVSIMDQLINGIAYAHSKGIAHRDLKPENIMLNIKHRKMNKGSISTDQILEANDLSLSNECNFHANLTYFSVVDEIELKICDFGLAAQLKPLPKSTDFFTYRNSFNSSSNSITENFEKDGEANTIFVSTPRDSLYTPRSQATSKAIKNFNEKNLKHSSSNLSTLDQNDQNNYLCFIETELIGSPGFLPPELRMQRVYNPLKGDVWSIGCMLLEMVIDADMFKHLWINAYESHLLSSSSIFKAQLLSNISLLLKDYLCPVAIPTYRSSSNSEAELKEDLMFPLSRENSCSSLDNDNNSNKTNKGNPDPSKVSLVTELYEILTHSLLVDPQDRFTSDMLQDILEDYRIFGSQSIDSFSDLDDDTKTTDGHKMKRKDKQMNQDNKGKDFGGNESGKHLSFEVHAANMNLVDSKSYFMRHSSSVEKDLLKEDEDGFYEYKYADEVSENNTQARQRNNSNWSRSNNGLLKTLASPYTSLKNSFVLSKSPTGGSSLAAYTKPLFSWRKRVDTISDATDINNNNNHDHDDEYDDLQKTGKETETMKQQSENQSILSFGLKRTKSIRVSTSKKIPGTGDARSIHINDLKTPKAKPGSSVVGSTIFQPSSWTDNNSVTSNFSSNSGGSTVPNPNFNFSSSPSNKLSFLLNSTNGGTPGGSPRISTMNQNTNSITPVAITSRLSFKNLLSTTLSPNSFQAGSKSDTVNNDGKGWLQNEEDYGENEKEDVASRYFQRSKSTPPQLNINHEINVKSQLFSSGLPNLNGNSSNTNMSTRESDISGDGGRMPSSQINLKKKLSPVVTGSGQLVQTKSPTNLPLTRSMSRSNINATLATVEEKKD